MTFASDFMGSPGCLLDNDMTQQSLEPPSLSQTLTTSTAVEQASREARSVLGQCLSEYTHPDDPRYSDQISARLKEITIEQQEGELLKHVEHLFSKSTSNAAYQLLRYAAYLSSNSLLSFDRTTRLVRWVAQNENVWAIERLLDSQLPTIEIFCGNLLVAAAELEEIDIVKALLLKGVNPNHLGGESHNKETALHRASRQEAVELVELLLRNGANPNTHSIGCNQTAFEVALASCYPMRPGIPLMMIRAGAKVVRSLSSIEDQPYLAMAAKFQSLELVQVMISAGASVNDDTGFAASALQIATESDNIEVVEALLSAGTDVNYPLGEQYRRGREQLVTTSQDSFGSYLQTPLHFAISQGNMEMVQILLEAGADVNSCPLLEYLPWLHLNNEDGKDNRKDDSKDEHIVHHKASANRRLILWIEGAHSEEEPNIASTPLQEAVWLNKAAAIRLLLRLGADVNAAGGFATALQAAAFVEDVHLIRLLLNKGADVNSPARGRGAMTALQAAASTGHEKAVEALLKAKADINAPPSSVEGRTALQAAVESRNISLVRALLEAGAKVNARAAPEDGKTCLQAAAEIGNTDMINLLLQSGARTNTAPYSGNKIYALVEDAIETNKQDEILRLVSTYIPKYSEDPGIAGLIITAIRQENDVLAQQLFTRASTTIRMACIQRFLRTAIQAGLLKLVHLFIEAGANINVHIDGELPVETAVNHSRPASLRILLEAGANVQGMIGAKAVANACGTFDASSPSMLHVLLSAGTSPKKVPGCKSPLQIAIERWCIKEDIVRLLLLHGADANEDSGIPLQLAAAKGSVPVVDLLLQARADVNAPATHARQKTALQGAAKTSRTDLVEKLLDAGADINALPSREWGTTALQAAVDSGSSTMVRLLLSRGADVNGPPSSAYGATALQKAVINGNLVITSLLLKHGADVNAPAGRSHGRTALEAAAEHGRLDILYLLLRNDEDPDTFSLRCRRAAKLAERSGHLVLARVMEEWRVSHCKADNGGQ